MKSYDLDKVLQSRADHEVSGSRKGRFWDMEPFDGGSTWIGKWIGESPWEKHVKGDEFIHVLRGEVEIILITSDGKKSVFVSEGSIFVVPADHWHQQRARSEVIILGATPGVTDHSETDPSLS